jgi:DNA modification methylase
MDGNKYPHEKGQGWAGGVTRKDSSFYVKKRLWESEHGKKISTEEFRLNHWEPDESYTGTSIFDPVLCELAYRWFCPAGGSVLDPFAGGSVRGVVASKLGLQYVGIELRQEQIEANEAQALAICAEEAHLPTWKPGDAKDAASLCEGISVDFVFSCPPYGDLEIYSDDERDLSNMDADVFQDSYADCINAACSLLKNDRFACFIVGDYRSRDGYMSNFISNTIAAFASAGLKLYNEAILLTAIGSLPIRAGKQFVSGRKMGKTHQNVLVFVKGDWRKAVEACGEIEVAFPDGMTHELNEEIAEINNVLAVAGEAEDTNA